MRLTLLVLALAAALAAADKMSLSLKSTNHGPQIPPSSRQSKSSSASKSDQSKGTSPTKSPESKPSSDDDKGPDNAAAAANPTTALALATLSLMVIIANI